MDEQTNETPTQVELTPQAAQPAKNPNLNAALSYVLGPISGIFFLLTEKENDYVRFHAAQSTVTFGILWLIGFIPLLGFLVILIGPITLLLWILLIYKAYQGERFALPIVGDLADKLRQSI